MPTFVQWIHLIAAVIGVGAIGFLLVILFPSARGLHPDQWELLQKAVLERFRWISWSVIVLLLGSGLYNVRQFFWEVAWGRTWKFLTAKIILALVVFAISLCLTLPLKIFAWFRARRKVWLSVAFILAAIVIYISAYLRRG